LAGLVSAGLCPEIARATRPFRPKVTFDDGSDSAAEGCKVPSFAAHGVFFRIAEVLDGVEGGFVSRGAAAASSHLGNSAPLGLEGSAEALQGVVLTLVAGIRGGLGTRHRRDESAKPLSAVEPGARRNTSKKQLPGDLTTGEEADGRKEQVVDTDRNAPSAQARRGRIEG
jgi:hypothetical protein